MAEAKKRSRLSRLVSWVQAKLAASGIGTFSKRAVKIGLIVTGVLALLIVANLLSRRAEPAFDRAFGAAVTQPATRAVDFEAKIDHLAVQQESLRLTLLELGATCKPADAAPVIVRAAAVPVRRPPQPQPPAPVRKPEPAPETIPDWAKRALGLTQ